MRKIRKYIIKIRFSENYLIMLFVEIYGKWNESRVTF